MILYILHKTLEKKSQFSILLWGFRLLRLCFNVPGYYVALLRLEQSLSERKQDIWLEETGEMQENTTLTDAGQILNMVSYMKSLPLILKCTKPTSLVIKK